MSRVAKSPVKVPKGVEIKIDQHHISVKGPKGILQRDINALVKITEVNSELPEIHFSPASNDPNAWAQAGTARALVNNMIKGVVTGFTKTLELVGVGYRVQVKDKVLALALGYSHPIEYKLREGITAEAPTVTSLVLHSLDKQLLGQVAAEIRAFRPPEPYKGKGVRYAGELIAIKETKKK
jgi:large subunit ribosomal protein L6